MYVLVKDIDVKSQLKIMFVLSRFIICETPCVVQFHGELVSTAIVGLWVGSNVGAVLGECVFCGCGVEDVVTTCVGPIVGCADGLPVGDGVTMGCGVEVIDSNTGEVVGDKLGCLLGAKLGLLLGTTVGVLLGAKLGILLGTTVGVLLGAKLGLLLGTTVGVLLGAKLGAAVGWIVLIVNVFVPVSQLKPSLLLVFSVEFNRSSEMSDKEVKRITQMASLRRKMCSLL